MRKLYFLITLEGLHRKASTYIVQESHKVWHTFLSRLGFELVTLIFERLKTYAPLTLQHCAGQFHN